MEWQKGREVGDTSSEGLKGGRKSTRHSKEQAEILVSRKSVLGSDVSGWPLKGPRGKG